MERSFKEEVKSLRLGDGSAGSGSDVVTGFIAGLQVYGQLGRALNLAHYEQGWHPTGTFGSIATAVAAEALRRRWLERHDYIAPSSAGCSYFATPKQQFEARDTVLAREGNILQRAV